MNSWLKMPTKLIWNREQCFTTDSWKLTYFWLRKLWMEIMKKYLNSMKTKTRNWEKGCFWSSIRCLWFTKNHQKDSWKIRSSDKLRQLRKSTMGKEDGTPWKRMDKQIRKKMRKRRKKKKINLRNWLPYLISNNSVHL